MEYLKFPEGCIILLHKLARIAQILRTADIQPLRYQIISTCINYKKQLQIRIYNKTSKTNFKTLPELLVSLIMNFYKLLLRHTVLYMSYLPHMWAKQSFCQNTHLQSCTHFLSFSNIPPSDPSVSNCQCSGICSNCCPHKNNCLLTFTTVNHSKRSKPALCSTSCKNSQFVFLYQENSLNFFYSHLQSRLLFWRWMISIFNPF